METKLKPGPFAIGWLLLVLLVLLAALLRGPAFDSSILTLLPESEQQPLVQRARDRIGAEFSSRLLLLVTAAEDANARTAVASLARTLTGLAAVARVEWRMTDDDFSRSREQLFAYRFYLLAPDLRQAMLDGAYRQITQQALVKLFGPVSAGDLIEDPFGLFPGLMRSHSHGLRLDLSQNLLRLRDTAQPTYLISVQLAGDPFAVELQRDLLQAVDRERTRLGERVESIRMSGMLVHAAAGARQAQREISTIGLGSLGGILVLMLLVFGRGKSLLLLLFPIATGCLFAAAVTLLIFGRVHLVTLAFGAGLVGVSVDYALHFLCERRYSRATRILGRIIAGLALGLFSSVMAYAVMLLAPFPGLRQMAAFSVAGLFASWITVVLWLPILTRRDETRALAAARLLQGWRRCFPRIDRTGWMLASAALMIALSLGAVWHSVPRDDVRLLQTSPPELLRQEAEIQRALGSASSSQYLLVRGSSLEHCLQREESLLPALRELQRDAVIDGFRALSQMLPSLQRQAQNYRLIGELYARELDSLYAPLELPADAAVQARARFEAAAEARLTPAVWRELDAGAARQQLILDQSPASAATVIRFPGSLDAGARASLAELAAASEGVIYVDQIADLSALLRDYRGQIQNWLILAYLIVLVTLALRYRRQVWRILLPPLLASLLTLALLAQLEQGINLFHLIALILVLGIGLDMGIFLHETDEAAQTWLAVSLSALTSLLAFGLLALSRTPVLHHFGITVALGLSLVWLLSPCVRRREAGNLE